MARPISAAVATTATVIAAPRAGRAPSRRSSRLAVTGLALAAGGWILAGCAEQPDPGASRGPDPSAEPAADARAEEASSEGEQAPGWRQSTLGKAMDRAEDVVGQMEEHDRERMRMIDEMNGRETPPEGEGGEGDGRDADGR